MVLRRFALEFLFAVAGATIAAHQTRGDPNRG